MFKTMENVSQDFVNRIVENAAWGQVGSPINKKVEEVKEPVKEKEKAKVVESKEKEIVEHSCPLCSSKLTEAISDEVLLDHTAKILEAVNEANLINESEDEDEDEDLLSEDDEDEDEDSDEDEEDEDSEDEEDEE